MLAHPESDHLWPARCSPDAAADKPAHTCSDHTADAGFLQCKMKRPGTHTFDAGGVEGVSGGAAGMDWRHGPVAALGAAPQRGARGVVAPVNRAIGHGTRLGRTD